METKDIYTLVGYRNIPLLSASSVDKIIKFVKEQDRPFKTELKLSEKHSAQWTFNIWVNWGGRVKKIEHEISRSTYIED